MFPYHGSVFDSPVRNRRFPAGDLADDLQAKCMEGAHFHTPGRHADTRETSFETFLKFFRGQLVVGHQQRSFGPGITLSYREGCLGDHGRCLAGTRGSNDQNTAVTADHGTCLLVGQGLRFDAVEKSAPMPHITLDNGEVAPLPTEWAFLFMEFEQRREAGSLEAHTTCDIRSIKNVEKLARARRQLRSMRRQAFLAVRGEPEFVQGIVLMAFPPARRHVSGPGTQVSIQIFQQEAVRSHPDPIVYRGLENLALLPWQAQKLHVARTRPWQRDDGMEEAKAHLWKRVRVQGDLVRSIARPLELQDAIAQA